MPKLDRVRIAGYKSIREQEISLGPLNVMIGANGAGKSNFIGVFRLLHEIVGERLQIHVRKAGGADQLLHFGRKVTEQLELRFEFGRNAYSCRLEPTADGALVFGEELIFYHGPGYREPYDEWLGGGHEETKLRERASSASSMTIADHVLKAFDTWKIYHFHDTGESAKLKQTDDLADNTRLRPDAGNLAAFLYWLKEREQDTYRDIVDAVKMVAPFFGGFDLAPDRLNPEKIRLEWHERSSDAYFNAHALSDGTLRFISLATLLLQPELPTTILLDEPELGLHPYAITVLVELLHAAAEKTQILVSTQSATLINQLTPEEILVVDREEGASVFRRLEEADIESWLDDYALGELWEKNVLGGRPGS